MDIQPEMVATLKNKDFRFFNLFYKKNIELLHCIEKYLISLSFAGEFDEEIFVHLKSIVENAKDLNQLQETSLYCICMQQRKKNSMVIQVLLYF